MELKQKSTTRTILQNKSLHLYCQQVADYLNESGISVELFFKNLEVDFTMEMIKSAIKKIAKTKFGVDSTSKLTTIQLTACYEELNRHNAGHGFHIPFPSLETLNQTI